MQMGYLVMNDKKIFDEDMYVFDNDARVDFVVNNCAYLKFNGDSYSFCLNLFSWIADSKCYFYFYKNFNEGYENNLIDCFIFKVKMS